MTGHTLIIGESLSGKSSFAMIVGKELHRKNPVYVLDPMMDSRWIKAGFNLERDTDVFLERMTTIKSGTMIIDEAGASLEKDKRYDVFTTTARHYGHTTMICAHRSTQLTSVLRENCGTLVLFSASRESKDILYREWDNPLIYTKLNRGEFLYFRKFKPALKGRIDFATMKIKWIS